jgi:hypothetical protein
MNKGCFHALFWCVVNRDVILTCGWFEWVEFTPRTLLHTIVLVHV